MTASARSAVIAYGKQTAEGSALTAPAFETPMGGGMVGPERETDELPWTNETQDAVGAFVRRVGGTLDATLPVLPVSSGAILEAVLGARSTSGAGPYTHAITPSDSLPWMTFFYAQPGADSYWKVADLKVGSWELAWEPGSPLEMTVQGQGKTTTVADTKWGAATLDEGVTPFLTYIGATMKFESATTPAATTVRSIAGGSISANRNLDPIQTDGINYQYLAEQKRDIEVSLDDVVFEDSDLIRTIFTGSAGGTNMSGQVVYGSVDFLFIGSDQAASATRSLRIALPQVLWNIERVPEADPNGNTLRFTVTGRASKPASGASITATLINGSSGSVYA